MSTRDDELLFEKLKSLPPQQRAEVEDFVDFLAARAKKRIAVSQLFDTMGKLASLEPPLTEEEIDAEIDAARANRARRRWHQHGRLRLPLGRTARGCTHRGA